MKARDDRYRVYQTLSISDPASAEEIPLKPYSWIHVPMRQIDHKDSQHVPELASFAETCPCLHLVQHDIHQAAPGMLERQPPACFAGQVIFTLHLLPHSCHSCQYRWRLLMLHRRHSPKSIARCMLMRSRLATGAACTCCLLTFASIDTSVGQATLAAAYLERPTAGTEYGAVFVHICLCRCKFETCRIPEHLAYSASVRIGGLCMLMKPCV